VIAIGEARSFWSRWLQPKWLCSCGRPLADCDRWAPVGAETWPMSAEDVTRFQARHLRTRQYVPAWTRLRFGRPSDRERRYAETYAELYRRVDGLNDATTIVDSSKYPLDAYLLGACTDVDLRVVHLVRDPRAVAHSWATPKPLTPEPGAPMLRTFSPVSSSTIWMTWNQVVERLVSRVAPVHRVRYEDLVARPAETLGGIAAFAGIADGRPLDPSTLSLRASHMVAGNPMRFTRGDHLLEEDGRWRTAMTRSQRLAAVVPAWPTMRRYGYRVWR
jgi:hypothetical protein